MRPRIPQSWWIQYGLDRVHLKLAPPAYGTMADALPFAGRGIMLGSNPDVWEQAETLARQGELEVVATIPGTVYRFSCPVVTWLPPEMEQRPVAIVQAENKAQWDTAAGSPGIVLNSWTYGKLNNRVALVEAYYNEGQGLDFGVFANYMATGAQAVIPVCGGYSATGRSDEESARIYKSLGSLPFPGFWMYAGESMLTEECVSVLKEWR